MGFKGNVQILQMMQDFMKQITTLLENIESCVEAFTCEDMAEPRTEKKIYKNDDTGVLEKKII